MGVTRRKVHIGKINTFLDPRSDLLLDREKKIFLHHLSETDGGKEKNGVKYKMVKYPLGYYVENVRSLDYESAVRRYIRNLQKSVDPRRVREITKKSIRNIPTRAKEIVMRVLNEVSPKSTVAEVRGVEARPYEYPQEFFSSLSKMKSLWDVPFSTLDGFIRNLSDITGEFNPMNYAEVFQRVRNVSRGGSPEEVMNSLENNVFAIMDSSGFRIMEKGDWMSLNLSTGKKKLIRVHIAVDSEAVDMGNVKVSR